MRDLIAAKEILTREEVMEVLKIGRSTFYKLIQTDSLKDSKRATDIRFQWNLLRNMWIRG